MLGVAVDERLELALPEGGERLAVPFVHLAVDLAELDGRSLPGERGEGAACGDLGELAVVADEDQPRAGLGPLSVRRAIARSEPVGGAGTTEPARAPAATGEPTPLWHLPLVVAALTLPLVVLGAWDAGLRVTGGCALVGLAQALLLARVVQADERATGRTYVRASGSRILRGTRLAHEQSRA